MNVCFIVTQLTGGGAERVASHLANYFVTKDVGVSIICTSAKPMQTYSTDSKVDVIHLSETKLNFAKKLFKFKKIIKQISPDILVSFIPTSGVYASVFKKSIKAKFVASERNSPIDSPKSKLERFFRYFVYNQADGLVFQSLGAKNYFSKNIQKKGWIIFNPLPCTELPEANYSIKRFIAAGRITRQKNYLLMLRAYKKYSGEKKVLPLVIFGRDYSNGEFLKDIHYLHLDNLVTWRDYSGKIWNEMANSSAFCLSSFFEGMPNALIEAAAIGLPIITTDYRPGGASDFVKNGYNGYVCENDDVDSFSSALVDVAGDLQNFQKRAFAHRLYVQQLCDINAIGDQWLNLFDSILSKSSE